MLLSEEKSNAARRLAYLWNLRDKNPQQYIKIGGGIEKEEIYSKYGDEVISEARKLLKTS